MGQTSTPQTGPDGDASSNILGKYIFTEASQGNNNNITHMRPPCIDLSNLTCALLEFEYHMYGSEINKLRISIDTGKNTSNWTLLEDIVGQQQTKTTDPWQKYSVDLTDYIGDYARLRFTGIRGSGARGDIAIDNINIYEPTIYEVALREVFNPENGYCSYGKYG